MLPSSLWRWYKEVPKVLKNKKSELGLISLLTLIFGSVLFASAVVLNSTNNFSNDMILNNTLSNTSADTNITLINKTANLTVPIENASLPNQSAIVNGTINITTPIDNNQPINETGNLSLYITINNQTYINQTNITLINQSTNISEGLVETNSSNFTIINYSAIIIENQSAGNISRLAKLFNEDKVEFDKNFRDDYLSKRNNFSDLHFKKVILKENARLIVGNREDNIKGFEVNNKSFAIDLIGCNSYSKYCAFRINGVPTKQMYSIKDFPNRKISFDLDGQYVMKIDNITFDFCDNRRFCHLGYEGYNVVDISIERK